MSTLVISRYGFVWCPSCGRTEERGSEIEPLPFHRPCETFMEVLLCEAVGCETEASVHAENGHFCQQHA